MPLPESALTTLATAAGELGITPGEDSAVDARLERYITVASDRLASMCDRDFHHVEGHTERVGNAGGTYLLVSDHLPVVSIASIEWDDGIGDATTVDDTAYRLTDDAAKSGMIERVKGAWRSTQVERQEIERKPTHRSRPLYLVTYTGGWVTPQQVADDDTLTRTLPYDIEDAVVQYVTMRERQRGKDGSVSSKSVGPASVSYETVDGQRVPPAFASVVRTHRRRSFA